MSSEGIPFDGVLSRDNFLNAQRLSNKRMRWILCLTVFAVVTSLATMAYVNNGRKVFAMIVVALGVAYVPLVLAIGEWRQGHVYDNSPYLHQHHRGMLNETSLHIEGPNGRSNIPWRDFTKLRASDNLLLLYVGPNVFHILAKDYFVSDGEWQQARTLALRQVSN